MDYSKMSDFEINNLVAISLGAKVTDSYRVGEERETVYYSLFDDEFAIRRGFGNINEDFDPCNKPADAWPIITENNIAVVPYKHTIPQAWPTSFGLVSKFTTEDRNPLRAAMITFLKMQESKNAKIPSERDS